MPLRSAFAAMLFTLMAGTAVADQVSQAPLSAGGNVPGNLALVPSVEWPTIDSMANLDAYSSSKTYVGYFDPFKCYKYSYSATESERHFYPVGKTNTRTCDYTKKEWSGNYLNWAATQTIDPFRKALTGGLRVKDTPTETWLEKARYDGNGGNSIYPNRRIPESGDNKTLVRGATPFDWNNLSIRIWKLGNKMRFTRSGSLDGSATAYDPSATIDASKVYEVSVRVKVCDESVGLEANCRKYSQGYKPEGLIQQYSGRIRYSVFGYLNDSDMKRDGGVLRAKQKFVGAKRINPQDGSTEANPNQEWDPDTGVLIRNPDPDDASATTSAVGKTIADSGVINYLNKFGQMTTWDHKSHDPVSELYYTALRYLRNMGNVPEYTNLSGTADEKYALADGFPVITSWDDPMQYRCQSNTILGIGDVNTHRDKNLPGNKASTKDEPSMPALVSKDDIDVPAWTKKVADLEGITINTPFTGRENSAYMAGLAYYAHTNDLRSDLDDKQTVSTYWVDVRENQKLEPKASNQYWLTAKYGGFTVPEDFDPDTHKTALPASWWNTGGEKLSTGDLRPDNFYVASEADKMVESLTRAFAKIATESVGSSASLAANSTRLETGTQTFQAQFVSGSWRGDLKAYSVASDGSLSTSPIWRAADRLAATTWSSRKIFVHNPQGSGAAKYAAFTWANLGSKQTAALGSQDVVDYLRGNRAKEEAQAGGTMRTRLSVLGDIVNSTPVFVGQPNARLYSPSANFDGASKYAAFAAKTRTPVVYVGANDGMLHGFDAGNDPATYGTETYAFVPDTVIRNGLKEYTQPDYEHRYFVDGDLAVADVYDGTDWKTVLVGTLGRGGPGVFALDVTDPANVKFLWEKNGTDIPALGKNIGKPVIAQVANGDWRVILGNGLDSSGGSAQLILIGVTTGTVKVVDTGVAGDNGLTAVLARDNDLNGFAETAYAGDLKGNLWKFSSLAGTTTVTSLFVAKDPDGTPQPITAAPMVGKDPATGVTWVFFGTGKYLTESDLSDDQIQTWYGIKDTGTGVAGRLELVERSILAEGLIGEMGVRVIEEGTADELLTKKGWYIDLESPVNGAEGERMVVPNRFQGSALIGTTRIPDSSDLCRPGGRGFVMAINPFTGARLDDTFFDVNGDGKFDDADKLEVDGELVVVSGVGFGSSPNNPIFIQDVMQVSLDDGRTKTLKTQGSAVQAVRLNWREIRN